MIIGYFTVLFCCYEHLRAQLFFILYIKIFVQYIVFFVHLTYNIIITEKEMIIWLEPQQTSASAWIQI